MNIPATVDDLTPEWFSDVMGVENANVVDPIAHDVGEPLWCQVIDGGRDVHCCASGA